MFWLNDLDSKKTSRSSSCIPKFNQNYNELKMKKKKNLYSLSKNSMKNENIKLYNIKYFSKKKIIKYPKKN